MQTILLDDFIDDGIIKEKSFRAKVDDMDFDKFVDQKVIIKGCAGVTVQLGLTLFLLRNYLR